VLGVYLITFPTGSGVVGCTEQHLQPVSKCFHKYNIETEALKLQNFLFYYLLNKF
jgi:hypothetical protein